MLQPAVEPKENAEGVNLFVSMLVRYPQIGAINFEAGNNSLKFTFLISGVIPPRDYQPVKKLIAESLDAYHTLLDVQNTVLKIDLSAYDGVTILTVVRDVPTLACGEIALLVSILSEAFRDSLARDLSDPLFTLNTEDLLEYDEAIEDLLKDFRRQNAQKSSDSLIGVRENGRVFVFNR